MHHPPPPLPPERQSARQLQDKRSRGYLFRTRKSAGQQVRNRKGGYLFRTRKDLLSSGAAAANGKRAEYLFRTRRTPYQAKRQQGSYLFRTRGGGDLTFCSAVQSRNFFIAMQTCMRQPVRQTIIVIYISGNRPIKDY